jgi:hypothetical protein
MHEASYCRFSVDTLCVGYQHERSARVFVKPIVMGLVPKTDLMRRGCGAPGTRPRRFTGVLSGLWQEGSCSSCTMAHTSSHLDHTAPTVSIRRLRIHSPPGIRRAPCALAHIGRRLLLMPLTAWSRLAVRL